MVKTNDTTNHNAKIFLGVIFLKFSFALGFVNLNSTEEMQIRNKITAIWGVKEETLSMAAEPQTEYNK